MTMTSLDSKVGMHTAAIPAKTCSLHVGGGWSTALYVTPIDGFHGVWLHFPRARVGVCV